MKELLQGIEVTWSTVACLRLATQGNHKNDSQSFKFKLEIRILPNATLNLPSILEMILLSLIR